ncbi:MAG: hypothetical protein PHY99_06490, partial [Bacteroidales bacterium]|nr:hypothetical protein [Bacteroidales bacterium]
MRLKRFMCYLILLNSWIGAQGQVFPGLKQSEVVCAADRTDVWMNLITAKEIGVVANPSSRIGSSHL